MSKCSDLHDLLLLSCKEWPKSVGVCVLGACKSWIFSTPAISCALKALLQLPPQYEQPVHPYSCEAWHWGCTVLQRDMRGEDGAASDCWHMESKIKVTIPCLRIRALQL